MELKGLISGLTKYDAVKEHYPGWQFHARQKHVSPRRYGILGNEPKLVKPFEQ